MSVNLIAAAAIVAAGVATWATHGPVLVDKAQASEPSTRLCKRVELIGQAEKRGLAGTENKTRMLAVADWERQAASLGGAFAHWASSSGRDVQCQRSIFTVRCIARSTPCAA